MHKHPGFTLVEIVIVIVIISTLLATGLPSYYSSMERAKCRTATSTLKTLASGAWDFYADAETFTGLSVAAINTQTGANIIDTNEWTYTAVATGGGTGFLLTSNRQRGPHFVANNRTITLDQDEVWAGSYPYETPGTW